jgi:predicted nuclease of predicted toxin-antitoxin system
MPLNIVDANLPFKVSCWSSEAYLHVLKLNPGWNDSEIWNHAKQHQLIIITKDKDFTVKQAIKGSPPKIVHIKFGNFKLVGFINRIEAVWNEVEKLLQIIL